MGESLVVRLPAEVKRDWGRLRRLIVRLMGLARTVQDKGDDIKDILDRYDDFMKAWSKMLVTKEDIEEFHDEVIRARGVLTGYPARLEDIIDDLEAIADQLEERL